MGNIVAEAPAKDKHSSLDAALPSPDKGPLDVSKLNPLSPYPATTQKIAGFGMFLFFTGLFVAALWEPHYWSLSVLCSSAFMVLGWAVGFLFGVPRTAADDSHTNTNLEQISDWLTKVLVGVGLTQLREIPHKLGLLALYISTDYGTARKNQVFAFSMILYFSALGFLIGYLITRLALQKDFEDHNDVQVKTPTAEIRVNKSDGRDADNLSRDNDNATRDKVQVKAGSTEIRVDESDAAAKVEQTTASKKAIPSDTEVATEPA